MRLARSEGATITESLTAPEKKGKFYPLISKEPMKNIKHMEMRPSFLQGRRMTLGSCRGYVIGELGRRQEGQISVFSKFEAREAETSGRQVVIQRGQVT